MFASHLEWIRDESAGIYFSLKKKDDITIIIETAMLYFFNLPRRERSILLNISSTKIIAILNPSSSY